MVELYLGMASNAISLRPALKIVHWDLPSGWYEGYTSIVSGIIVVQYFIW